MPYDDKQPEEKTALISELSTLPPWRKYLVLIFLCTALFFDTFNNSSLCTALPVLSSQIHISNNESVWLFGAYQLACAALLLICGRISDLYNPKWVFLIGSISLAITSVIAAFIRKEIPLIVLRGLMGAGASLTIPSSQHIIVHMFPDPNSQAKALALFTGMAGFGIVSGLLMGAVFVQFLSWAWIFYFVAIISGTVSLFVLVLLPNLRRTNTAETTAEKILRFKRLDLFGGSIVTATLILFIFAVTSGSSVGWGSAQVIAPLILSAFLAICFFMWEAYIPEEDAALPPRVWKYENVTILVAMSFVPFMWLCSIYTLFSWVWQVVDDWSPVKVAVHFVPVALASLPVIPLTTEAVKKFPAKWIIFAGFILNIIGTALLPFNNSPSQYWRFGFPGFILGSFGVYTIYSTANIALFANTPPHISGVISGVSIAAGQTGAAAGLALITSIQTSVEKHHGGPFEFDGRAAGLWFLAATSAVFAVLLLIFMTNAGPQPAGLSVKYIPVDNTSERQLLSQGDVEPNDEDKISL